MKKKKKSYRIKIELDSEHLPVLIDSLEVYSRFRSGQIAMALDTVYWKDNLSYEEKYFLERVVRSVVFPKSPTRNYDKHRGFYDEYDNEYDENGNISNESSEWKLKKDRTHLEHPHSYLGVGSIGVMKEGTIAWEIKKVIEEYLHYKRNEGYRDTTVDGDGVLNISRIPDAKIIDPETQEYWKPEKWFLIPKHRQQKIKELINNSKFTEMWSLIDKIFKNKPLPRGNSSKIIEKNSLYYVVIEKPFKL